MVSFVAPSLLPSFADERNATTRHRKTARACVRNVAHDAPEKADSPQPRPSSCASGQKNYKRTFARASSGGQQPTTARGATRAIFFSASLDVFPVQKAFIYVCTTSETLRSAKEVLRARETPHARNQKEALMPELTLSALHSEKRRV